MRLTRKRVVASAAALTGIALAVTPTVSWASDSHGGNHKAIPRYQHIIEIMMENTSYGTLIGNANAPVHQQAGGQLRAGD